jgi:hypothetical protein
MVKAQLEASLIVPAQATKQQMTENAMAQVADIRGQAQAELDQLRRTIEILQEGGDQGVTAYIIENFGEIVGSFAKTMELFPVEEVTVITGRPQHEGPISAIHPSAIDADLNRRLAAVLDGAESDPATNGRSD